MVVPRFVEQAVESKPITVYGDGKQTRTFTHVHDTVEALIRLMESEQANGEVVNVGGNEEVSILELAERVKMKARSGSEIRLIPYDEVFPRDFEDMQRRVPSTEKLWRLTGFVPTIGLDAILDDVIAHHRS
jgi:UDP-glucose 4-epimerase